MEIEMNAYDQWDGKLFFKRTGSNLQWITASANAVKT